MVAGQSMTAPQDLLVGIFVGGKSSRMGGRPKGLLPAPDNDDTLVERLLRVVEAALPGVEVVLVGESTPYDSLDVRAVPDDPPDMGPLGGLCALLNEAEQSGRAAIAIACDLPYATEELVGRLASHAPTASVVAPRLDGFWQPMFARYDPKRALPAALEALDNDERSLQSVFARLPEPAATLPIESSEAPLLADWDSPEDIEGPR